jgi:hypothetical protein
MPPGDGGCAAEQLLHIDTIPERQELPPALETPRHTPAPQGRGGDRELITPVLATTSSLLNASFCAKKAGYFIHY